MTDKEDSHAGTESRGSDQSERDYESVRRGRMELLACLTRGFVHDFNNALTPILGASDFILTHQQVLDNHEDLLQLLGTVRDSAGSARDMVDRLRGMYRVDQKRDILEVSVNQLLQLVVATVKDEWRELKPERLETLSIDLQLGEIPVVALSESRMRTAFHNILNNAADAMDETGGTVTISTGAEDDRIVVDIRDSGKGMTAEESVQCLDPFYTTKHFDGSGLGLTIADYIIFSNGGTLSITSTPGEGTQVRIAMSTVREAVPAEPAPAEPGIEVPTMRILLLDDDERVRDIATRFLNADGHEVTVADTLQDVQSGADAADLLLVDYGSYGSDKDAIGDLATQNGVGVVWMINYSEDVPPSVRDTLGTILRKPFIYPELQTSLLGARASTG